jgi:ribosomal protein L31E
MKTSDVRVDVKLNKAVWSKGIRNVRLSPRASLTDRHRVRVSTRARVFESHCVLDSRCSDLASSFFSTPSQQVPRKLRIQISRRRNDDEDAEEDLYSYVTVVEVPNGLSGLGTKVVDEL